LLNKPRLSQSYQDVHISYVVDIIVASHVTF